VVTAGQRRACADYLRETYEISQRKAGQVLGCSRSTLRYRAADRSEDLPLLGAIRRLAGKYPRWGRAYASPLA
jgi:hypothetical protein